jgi:prepilin peptidase CpaA
LRLYFTLAITLVMTLAAVLDLRSRRIPNPLIVLGLAAALLPRFAVGLAAVGMGVAGAGVGLLIGLGLFALGAMAGGDGKLLMVVGAFFGPVQLFGALLSIAVAGGILAIAAAIAGGTILPALLSTGRLLQYLVSFGRAGEARALESSGAQRVPYAVAIAAGSLFWWFWGGIV